MRRCGMCGRTEAETRFHKAARRCADCAIATTRQWTKDNPARTLVNNSRAGVPLTLDEAERALAIKAATLAAYGEEACWACGIVGPVVCDHNHETGEFRAWLCGDCNVAEGRLTVSQARKLAAFMEEHCAEN